MLDIYIIESQTIFPYSPGRAMETLRLSHEQTPQKGDVIYSNGKFWKVEIRAWKQDYTGIMLIVHHISRF